MSLADKSGLALLQDMQAGKLPHPSICETIPMRCMSVEKGKVVFEAQAGAGHLNPMGGVHGGFIATVMDSVTACAVHSMLEPGVGYATIDLNVKMLRPVPQNRVLSAEGSVINMSKSLGVSEGYLKDAEGKLYATATASCMILRR